LHSWNAQGVCGLLGRYRSGRPSKLSEENQYEAIERVKENPRKLKTVLAQLSELTG
jgi:transposase